MAAPQEEQRAPLGRITHVLFDMVSRHPNAAERGTKGANQARSPAPPNAPAADAPAAITRAARITPP